MSGRYPIRATALILVVVLGCRGAQRPSTGAPLSVFHDLAREAVSADAEYPAWVIHLASPAGAAHATRGFHRELLPSADWPHAAAETRADITLDLGFPKPRSVVLDIEPYPGLGAQTLDLHLNGAPITRLELAPGRRRYAAALPTAKQAQGSNTLGLSFAGGAPPAHGRRPLAARLYSLAVGDEGNPWMRGLGGEGAPPALDVTRGRGAPRLVQAGPSRLHYVLRLPGSAELLFGPRVTGTDPVSFRVTMNAGAGEAQSWSARLGPGAAGPEVRLQLGTQAGVIARLTLEVAGEGPGPSWAAWEAPRIVGREPPEGAPPPRDREVEDTTAALRRSLADVSVVLVILDAAGARHFGCYGYPRNTTPEIDAIAAEGLVFERAYTVAVNTRLAMAALWTSQYPDHNGSGVLTNVRLPAERLRLAQVLSKAGIHAAAAVANANANPGLGYDAGFGEFHSLYEGWGVAGGRVFRPFLRRFLEERRRSGGRFFLYLHYQEPHFPYDPPRRFLRRFLPASVTPLARGRAYALVHTVPKGTPRPFPSPEELEKLVAMYDANLAFGDHHVGWLRDAMKSAGLWDRAVIIVTADHGEALGEHGVIGHNDQVYEDSARIPLIVRFPPGLGPRGTRVRELVDLVDLAPTVLDIFGLAGQHGADAAFQGRSLLTAASGGPGKPMTLIRGVSPAADYALVDDWLKVVVPGDTVQGRRQEMYDLRGDAREGTDLAPRDPLRAEYQRQKLYRWVLALRPDAAGAGSERVRLSPEIRENLRALGYVN